VDVASSFWPLASGHQPLASSLELPAAGRLRKDLGARGEIASGGRPLSRWRAGNDR